MKLHLHTVIGEGELCAWAVSSGVCWIQARRPEYAGLLRKRSDTRRVLWAVCGPYLVTFQIERPLKFVRKLVQRYIHNLDAANEPFSASGPPYSSSNSADGVEIAEKGQEVVAEQAAIAVVEMQQGGEHE